LDTTQTTNPGKAMTFNPVIAFCRQRLSDLGAGQIANSTAIAAMQGVPENNKRAVAELLIIITLCEGLNKQEQLIHETKHANRSQET
jgi:hypothetical protein